MKFNSLSNEIWADRPDDLLDEELAAWAITTVAAAINKLTYDLGTHGASTHMGATEALADAIIKAARDIREGIEESVEELVVSNLRLPEVTEK